MLNFFNNYTKADIFMMHENGNFRLVREKKTKRNLKKNRIGDGRSG